MLRFFSALNRGLMHVCHFLSTIEQRLASLADIIVTAVCGLLLILLVGSVIVIPIVGMLNLVFGFMPITQHNHNMAIVFFAIAFFLFVVSSR